MTGVADQRERDAALDVGRSFIVQAPAGSGKTTLLVARYLKLLERVKRPEDILAVTFTRKAAAEMRRRVLEALPNAGEIAHRLRIQTIDSLCAALTRQMPVLARFGAQPEIVEDARELYQEAASRTLKTFSAAVVRLLSHLDNDVAAATALLAGMLACRDRWVRKTGAAPTRAELEAALAAERHRLLGKARALLPTASEGLAREVLTQKGEWRKRPAAPLHLLQIEGLREALFTLTRMPPEKYSDRQWEALEAILALLFPAIQQLRVAFAERGQADFTEFVHGALVALGSAEDPSELLLRLDSSIAHILVDEFQDTSVSQWELIERLTAGWQPGDGRTLFLVGDPMQSIYRFREAEVGLFLRARREGIGAVKLEPLTLATNFRSQASLVAWFNETFARVLPVAEDETAGAVPYSPASPHHPALAGPAVSWHGGQDRFAEAQRVVDLLKSATGKTAILVRNRTHLDAIVPALKEAGIPFRAVEIEYLGEKQVVQDLYALARALSHLADRVAWLAILRAPWCGLGLGDLALLTEEHPHRTVWELLHERSEALSADGCARAARLRDTLAPAIAGRLRGTLRDRVEGVWLALGGPACVDHATDLEDAESFLDELERLEEAGEVDLARLEKSLGELYALPDVEAGTEAVEIMTIHKAKGLEFDTVIVPGLDRPPRSGSRPLFAWKALPGARLLLAPIGETGGEDDAIYQYVRALESEAEDIEAGRLLYVSATRAESRLHLLACVACDDEGDPKPPAKRSLLGRLWFQAQAHVGPLPASPAKASVARLPETLWRLPAGFEVPAPPAPAPWRAAEGAPEASEIEFSWAGEVARHVGTVVHRWLQRMAEDGLCGWDARRVDSLRPRLAMEFERRGVPTEELGAAIERALTALRNALSDPRGRWILGPHAEARTEYRLRAVTERGVASCVIDRVFRDADGTRWIVDYKTSRHEGADSEAFLNRERERYARQLESYGRLLPGARCGLYFPLLKGWRDS